MSLKTRKSTRHLWKLCSESFYMAFGLFLPTAWIYLAHDALSDQEYPFLWGKALPVVIALLGLAFVFRLVIYFRYEVWGFNGRQLSRGSPVNLTLGLASIEAYMDGLPLKNRPMPLADWNDELSNMVRRYQRDALVLILDDNRVLPLYLDDFPGGGEIDEALRECLADKWVEHYPFNEKQMKKIGLLRLNTMIKLGKE